MKDTVLVVAIKILIYDRYDNDIYHCYNYYNNKITKLRHYISMNE